MLRVAIQGQTGSFHDIAARQYFGAAASIIPCEHFDDELALLNSGSADRAVCAIENSTSGTVIKSFDALRRNHYWISGEIVLRVEHCLIGIPGASLQTIAEIHSQAPALEQCEKFLDVSLPAAVRIEQHDTTASVRMVKEWNDPSKAAIASSMAAEIYGLPVIARGIQTQKNNFTRFLVLEKEAPGDPRGDKSSIILETPDIPGALYQALGVFADKSVNLTKIESHPIPDKPFVYRFYIDFEAGLQDPRVSRALAELHDLGCTATVLGTYARSTGHRE